MTRQWDIPADKQLTDQQVRDLLTYMQLWSVEDLKHGRRQGVVTWAVIDTLFRIGCRNGELCALNCGDVDLRHKLLHLVRLKKRKPQLDQLPMAELAPHLRDYLSWKKSHNESTKPHAPLFVSQRGVRFTTRGVRALFSRATEKSGLPASLSPHSARHTVGFRLRRNGHDPGLIRRWLGHSRLETTQVYMGVTPDELAAAAKEMYA